MNNVPFIAAGINLAFAFISFFIAYKKIDRRLYSLFGIFSLFSAFYFLTPTFNFPWQLSIIYAAVYYSVFSWFINSFVENEKRTIPILLTVVFILALLGFLLPDYRGIGQIIAHIGLCGLIIQLMLACIKLKKNDRGSYVDLAVLTLFFMLLAVDEILNLQFNAPLFGQYFDAFLPLDLFPVLFTFILGKRMAGDLIYKTRFQLATEKVKNKEAELHHKQKDLTDFGLELARNRAFLAKLHAEVKARTDDATAQQISAEIKSYLSNSNSAAILQKNVQLVNHEFTSKLKSRYPALSKSEIQICQLLRLQLSTKEIATIKNISQDSMKVMRYRIRKKLVLKKEENLASFLQSL
jgi:DNA-binding CsgD family transcriptional regulator